MGGAAGGWTWRRWWVALALALGLVTPAGARVGGGGPVSSDCFVEWDGITATSGTVVECTDGDPACDSDGACDGSCEFLVRLCLNQCATPPFSIERIKLAGPALEVPGLPMRERACGGFSSVGVPARTAGKRKRRRVKPTFKLTAWGSGRLKLDKDKVALVCKPRTDACPPLPEVKNDLVAEVPPLVVDPPSPAGGTPATATVDFPSASSVTLTAVGEGCGGFATHGPGASPFAVTQPVGVFGSCEITADVATPQGPRTFRTRFQVTPTDLVLPALEVPGALFMPGALPPATGGPDDPVIAAIEAPGSLVNGGSAQLRVQLADPARAADVRRVQVEVIGAGGYAGHFEAPAVLEGDTVVVEAVLASGFVPGATPAPWGPAALPGGIDLVVQLVDRFGNVGNAVMRSFGVVEVGSGEVQVSLSWDTPTDVDLHVVEPGGNEIYYASRTSESGGTLDLDSNASCNIDGVNNENVTWTGTPPAGPYTVRVDFWSDCGGYGANYTATVRYCGLVQTFRGSFAPGASDRGGRGSGVTVARFDTNCPARVRGRAVYEDLPQLVGGLAPTSTMLPIRFARVAVRRAADGAVLAEGSTKQDGAFDLPFGNEGAPGYWVEVRAEQDDAIVSQAVRDEIGTVYTARSEGTIDETAAPDTTVLVQARADGAAPAFNVFDTGVLGAMLVEAVHGTTPPHLDWVWTRGKKGTCPGAVTCYQPETESISVLSLAADPDEYDDLVLLHAYGHLYQRLHARTDSPGGTHSAESQVDPRLAWGEGSATFFAGAARGSSLYLDTRPGGPVVRWDLDTLPAAIPLGTSDGTPAGAVSEAVVGAVLWDLLDPTNEAGDTLAARDAVFGALGYLGGPHFTDRGAAGADLVDALDGWFCLGHGARGGASSGVEGNAVGLHHFGYDFAPLPSCR